MSTPPIPPEVPIVAATLRTAAEWLGNENRAMLREVADGVEHGWDEGGTCPLCEEMDCDEGCPLEHVRAKPNDPPTADQTGWFACFERGDDVANQAYPWRPVLSLGGHMVNADSWFKTEEECLDFIRTQILGQPLLSA